MAKFIIQPHDRLHEMVAHELGYFSAEGLDYEIDTRVPAQASKLLGSDGHVKEIRSGAYRAYEQGKGNKGTKSDVSCACHWTVNNAAANQLGTMYGKAYVVTPGGVMVRGDSPIRAPEDLAGIDVAVGYRSGSQTKQTPLLLGSSSRHVHSLWRWLAGSRPQARVSPCSRGPLPCYARENSLLPAKGILL